jgi:NAD(P)-dependent dehydrogenase (short-subunit alcohol dehydrogenase family)
MSDKRKTVIVTGASQGIGAGVAQRFLERGYNVVANSRLITKTDAFPQSERLALVEGDIGNQSVATKTVQTAIQRFGSVDALVNNAGIFSLSRSSTTPRRTSRPFLRPTSKAFSTSPRAR